MADDTLITGLLVAIILLSIFEVYKFIRHYHKNEQEIQNTEIKLYHPVKCGRCGKALKVERSFLKRNKSKIKCKNCRTALSYGVAVFRRFLYLCKITLLVAKTHNDTLEAVAKQVQSQQVVN